MSTQLFNPSPRDSNPPNRREEFASSGSHSPMHMGRAKKNIPGPYKNNFLTDTKGQTNNGRLQTTGKVDHLVSVGGLKTTKFGMGFNRKNEGNIENLRSQEYYEESLKASKRSEMLNRNRSEMLRTADSKYNYNLITGGDRRYDVYDELKETNQGKKQVGDGLGFEAPERGHAMLRDQPTGRYYTPQPSGMQQHYRQDIIIKEGLLHSKTSSIMKLPSYNFEEGRRKVGVIPSWGVEEQFSKSEYAHKSEVASSGLMESRSAGINSPRLQPDNPSGYKDLTQNWSKGIDFNCTGNRRDRPIRPESEFRPMTSMRDGVERTRFERTRPQTSTSNYY